VRKESENGKGSEGKETRERSVKRKEEETKNK
jgi:hypothetical protein